MGKNMERKRERGKKEGRGEREDTDLERKIGNKGESVVDENREREGRKKKRRVENEGGREERKVEGDEEGERAEGEEEGEESED